MPSKRDVRNNTAVNPQYAYLGLHQGAFSGNVGLVQYALSEGQPVDAVWDGISALHAAAAGGSEHVVRLLINSGADINFGRQPKNEREFKTRTASSSSTSPPLDKTSDMLGSPHAAEALLNPGSTPLHFACAHSNVAVTRLLLACGAAPHIPDKRGVTPLDLLPPITSPGPTSPSNTPPPSDLLRSVIREYYENEKAKEKEYQKSQNRFYGKAAAVLGFPRNDDDDKRVGGRQSVEHLSKSPKQASAQLTSPKHVPVPLPIPPPPPRRGIGNIGTPPPSPRHFSTPASDRERISPSPPSLSGYTFGSASSTLTFATIDPAPPLTPPEHRRPSLPHIFESPTSSLRAIRPPASTSTGRPRSADGTDSPVFGSGAISQNLSSALTNTCPRTKRSLLSLFKKVDCTPDDTREREIDAEREPGRGRLLSSACVGSLSPSKPQVHQEEVRTAPAERTTFAPSLRDHPRVPEDVFCDDDVYEDYGVPIKRMETEPTPGFLPFSPEQQYFGQDSGGATEDDDRGDSGDNDGEDTGEDTVEERTSTDAGMAVPIPIPSKYIEGTSLGVGLGLTSVGNNTPPPPPPPPPPPLPPPSPANVRLSPRTRRGILRGDSSVRHSGSRGALRFEGALRERGSSGSLAEKRERCTPLLREKASTAVREKTSPSGREMNSQSLREKNSRGSLRLNLGVPLGVDNRLRGDTLSSAMSYGSHNTSIGTTTSVNTTTSVPSLDPDSARGTTSSDEDEEDIVTPALGLSIRTVSNHAEAEALVQKAAKDILELKELTEGSSLSAQLAAYGETLQLERRFARGEAQRFKSPTRSASDLIPVAGDVEEAVEAERRREEERRKRAQERMIWSQRTMERYARGGSKERRSSETTKEREREQESAGYPLERSTSLEKDIGTGEVKSPKKPRSPKLRRPHTSDSVASAASGSTAPRFGHSATHSSGSLLRVTGSTQPLRVFHTEQGRRVHHQASQSTSTQAPTRSESFDGGTRPIPNPEFGEVDDVAPNANNATLNRSPLGQSNHLPLVPSTSSLYMASSATVDEFGTTGRPLKQRFGLRSLFGKSK